MLYSGIQPLLGVESLTTMCYIVYMPSKHVVRHFEEGGIYHVFNRGVEKRDIFLDEQDYRIFLYYLYIYVVPLERVLIKHPHMPIRLRSKNLSPEIEILAYCLMPNHFHLLVKQNSFDGVSKLLKQLTNAHARYFNKKYDRVGGLFQGRFKAVTIETNEQLLHTSRYIHLNPLVSDLTKDLKTYQWSSYLEYLNKKNDLICSKETISFFIPSGKYEDFVTDQADYAKELENIKHLAIDD